MNQASTKLIGAFIVGAVALIVVVFLVFGSGKLFTDTYEYVIYFRGSVNGLDAGAPVKIRGVTIGSVSEIVPLYYPNGEFAVEVKIKTERGILKTVEKLPVEFSQQKEVELLINDGLRAQLNTSSFVTGKLFINIDYFRDTETIFMKRNETDVEIPSIPSTTEMFENSLKSVMKGLENLNLVELTKSLSRTVRSVDTIMSSPMWQANLVMINENLIKTDTLFARLNRAVDPITDNLLETTLQTTETLNKIQLLVENLDNIAINNSYEIQVVLKEISRSAQALKRLAEYLEEHPSDIIFGK
jgi:phospholipid/cholesterol/gamma-HCH transport system substrate-binding protein